jgi:hypothetical protein
MGTGKLLIKLYSVNKRIISRSLSAKEQKQFRVQLKARIRTRSISSLLTITVTNIAALCNFHKILLTYTQILNTLFSRIQYISHCRHVYNSPLTNNVSYQTCTHICAVSPYHMSPKQLAPCFHYGHQAINRRQSSPDRCLQQKCYLFKSWIFFHGPTAQSACRCHLTFRHHSCSCHRL